MVEKVEGDGKGAYHLEFHSSYLDHHSGKQCPHDFRKRAFLTIRLLGRLGWNRNTSYRCPTCFPEPELHGVRRHSLYVVGFR